jgi:hypothetical protein
MKNKIIQSQNYNQETGRTFHEQFWNTSTFKPIKTDDWINIQNLIQDIVERMSNGEIVTVKIIEDEKM